LIVEAADLVFNQEFHNGPSYCQEVVENYQQIPEIDKLQFVIKRQWLTSIAGKICHRLLQCTHYTCCRVRMTVDAGQLKLTKG